MSQAKKSDLNMKLDGEDIPMVKLFFKMFSLHKKKISKFTDKFIRIDNILNFKVFFKLYNNLYINLIKLSEIDYSI